ncbi:MAG: hydrolase Nlp/P60 [Flavobacteriales bacterium CG_4_9_14_3_um_filter_40_17]|nr:MAG: hydrolase Nlp/P60 [Flavobacteriales bacterium CG_4_9_14_3_um_filter_40_17]
MVSQLLYGDTFRVLEHTKKWSQIETTFDKYTGWIDTEQMREFDEKNLSEKLTLSADLVEYIVEENNQLITIVLGSDVSHLKQLYHKHEGNTYSGKLSKNKLVEISLMYLNSPYLWGGKTPFGIDCSGLTQMVYKLSGYQLPRDAWQQANVGETLSFIEESEPGDLAFFDNSDGKIVHVGIILSNHQIIHAHGKVRIDKLDQYGIFNSDTNKHSHQLRVIKKVL